MKNIFNNYTSEFERGSSRFMSWEIRTWDIFSFSYSALKCRHHSNEHCLSWGLNTSLKNSAQYVVHSCNFAFQRPRQEDHCQFEASLGYLGNSSPAWITGWIPVSKKTYFFNATKCTETFSETLLTLYCGNL